MFSEYCAACTRSPHKRTSQGIRFSIPFLAKRDIQAATVDLEFPLLAQSNIQIARIEWPRSEEERTEHGRFYSAHPTGSLTHEESRAAILGGKARTWEKTNDQVDCCCCLCISMRVVRAGYVARAASSAG